MSCYDLIPRSHSRFSYFWDNLFSLDTDCRKKKNHTFRIRWAAPLPRVKITLRTLSTCSAPSLYLSQRISLKRLVHAHDTKVTDHLLLNNRSGLLTVHSEWFVTAPRKLRSQDSSAPRRACETLFCKISRELDGLIYSRFWAAHWSGVNSMLIRF